MGFSSSSGVASTTLAMLLADARLPAGAHVSSNGLEAALAAGLPAESVVDYMRTRMRTVVRVEAGTAVVARHAVLEFSSAEASRPEASCPEAVAGSSGPDVVGVGARPGGADGLTSSDPADPAGPDLTTVLDAITAEWAARTPSPALREIAVSLGSGLARLARTLWPQAAAVLGRTKRPRPVVLGVIAAHAGMSAADLVRVVAYDDAQTVAAAMLKLEPREPGLVTSYVLEACAEVERYVPDLVTLTSPDAIPAPGAPQLEDWAEAQSRLTRRLFRA